MKILLAAAISEGLLLVFALAAIYLANLNCPWNLTSANVAIGLILALPPLVANHLLWRHSDRYPHSIYGRFSREVVTPLCRNMSLPVAVSVAILSGTCEELFFRGAVNLMLAAYLGTAVACLISSALFAAMHFIGNFRRYGGMLPLYIAMGVYLWFAHHLTDSLASVAILHGVYNFVVIQLVKNKP
jgi:membrane protease YdiL (CAAX protease family)